MPFLTSNRNTHRFAKGNGRVGSFDLDFGVHEAQVVHYTIQVQLARAAVNKYSTSQHSMTKETYHVSKENDNVSKETCHVSKETCHVSKETCHVSEETYHH